MDRLLLAGDIGGTKAALALVSLDSAPGAVVREAVLPSRGYPGLDALLADFLGDKAAALQRVSLSVAGPVMKGRAWLPNLGWRVEGDRLAARLGARRVWLANDLEATAVAVPFLRPEQLAVLQEGAADPRGCRAVIAPGTGLGEAALLPDGPGFRALPSEGGHSDFAPADALQQRLLDFLRAEFGHVSYERVCSGQGIFNLYRFLLHDGAVPEPEWLARELAAAEDPTPVIVAAGTDGARTFAPCAEALRMFVEILAAEAANLAIRYLATGGVFIGGGIPPRLLALLRSPAFVAAFRRKGVMTELVRKIPVQVILEPRAALLGAVRQGLQEAPERDAECPVIAG